MNTNFNKLSIAFLFLLSITVYQTATPAETVKNMLNKAANILLLKSEPKPPENLVQAIARYNSFPNDDPTIEYWLSKTDLSKIDAVEAIHDRLQANALGAAAYVFHGDLVKKLIDKYGANPNAIHLNTSDGFFWTRILYRKCVYYPLLEKGLNPHRKIHTGQNSLCESDFFKNIVQYVDRTTLIMVLRKYGTNDNQLTDVIPPDKQRFDQACALVKATNLTLLANIQKASPLNGIVVPVFNEDVRAILAQFLTIDDSNKLIEARQLKFPAPDRDPGDRKGN